MSIWMKVFELERDENKAVEMPPMMMSADVEDASELKKF